MAPKARNTLPIHCTLSPVRADREAEGHAGLVALLRGRQQCVVGPGVGQRLVDRARCGIHRRHVDAGVLLQEVDAGGSRDK